MFFVTILIMFAAVFDHPILEHIQRAKDEAVIENWQDVLQTLEVAENLIEAHLAPDPDPDPGPDPTPEPMEVLVTEDSIQWHGHQIPRLLFPHDVSSVQSGDWNDPATWNNGLLPLPTDVACVSAGHVVQVTGEVDVDGVEVMGALDFAGGSTMAVSNIVVLPGGALTAGNELNPIPRETPIDIVLLDKPLDLVADPQSWHNGVVNFGRWEMYGEWVTPHVEFDAIAPGDSSVNWIGDDFRGWVAGDEIHFPATTTFTASQVTRPHRDKPYIINHRNADSNDISAQLTHETVPYQGDFSFQYLHTVGRNHLDEAIIYPSAANRSRAITIRSENPDGVRGHTLTTANGKQILVGMAFDDLGRTRAAPISELNQLGRYSVHWHHTLPGEAGGYMDNCVVNRSLKWGVTIHGAIGVEVLNTASIESAGSGFAVEHTKEANVEMGMSIARDWRFVNCYSSANDPADEHLDQRNKNTGLEVQSGDTNGNMEDGADSTCFYVATNPFGDFIDCQMYGSRWGIDVWHIVGDEATKNSGGYEWIIPKNKDADVGNAGYQWTRFKAFNIERDTHKLWGIGKLPGDIDGQHYNTLADSAAITVTDSDYVNCGVVHHVYTAGNATFINCRAVVDPMWNTDIKTQRAWSVGGNRYNSLRVIDCYTAGYAYPFWHRARSSHAAETLFLVKGGEHHYTTSGAYFTAFIASSSNTTVLDTDFIWDDRYLTVFNPQDFTTKWEQRRDSYLSKVNYVSQDSFELGHDFSTSKKNYWTPVFWDRYIKRPDGWYKVFYKAQHRDQVVASGLNIFDEGVEGQTSGATGIFFMGEDAFPYTTADWATNAYVKPVDPPEYDFNGLQ